MTRDKEKIQQRLCRRCAWATHRCGRQVVRLFPTCVWEQIKPRFYRDRMTGEVRRLE